MAVMKAPQKQTLAGLLCGLVLAGPLFVGGCQSGKRIVVSNTDPAPTVLGQKDKDETINDATGKIATANKTNSDAASREVIAAQVERIFGALRSASWTVVKATVEQLVTERNAAQADAAAKQDEIDRLTKELEAAKSDAERAAYLGVVRTFACIGAIISAVGVGLLLWSTYNRAGWLVLAAGPLVGGSGLLWGKPWFYVPLGVGALCLIFAGIIKTVWIVLDSDKNGKIDMLEKRTPKL